MDTNTTALSTVLQHRQTLQQQTGLPHCSSLRPWQARDRPITAAGDKNTIQATQVQGSVEMYSD